MKNIFLLLIFTISIQDIQKLKLFNSDYEVILNFHNDDEIVSTKNPLSGRFIRVTVDNEFKLYYDETLVTIKKVFVFIENTTIIIAFDDYYVSVEGKIETNLTDGEEITKNKLIFKASEGEILRVRAWKNDLLEEIDPLIFL